MRSLPAGLPSSCRRGTEVPVLCLCQYTSVPAVHGMHARRAPSAKQAALPPPQRAGYASAPRRRPDQAAQPGQLSPVRAGASPQSTARRAQEEFKRLAADFAARELAPHAARWDADKEFSVSTLRAAAGLGFGGLFCGEDVGGSALSRADGAVIFEVAACVAAAL